MLGLGCSVIILAFAVWAALAYLAANPEYWLLVIFLGAVLVILLIFWRRNVKDARVRLSLEMARNLESLAANFAEVESPFIKLHPGEKVFYELEGVQLREYRSTGSKIQNNYVGGNIALTKGLSVSLGSSSGDLTQRLEQSTVIDVGTATFTTQRVVFAGPSQSREWELEKLIGMEIGVSGFTVTPAVSNRSKTSTLAGDSSLGITPGILFAIAFEYSQNGEAAARKFAQDHADRIMEQVDYYYATGKLKKD